MCFATLGEVDEGFSAVVGVGAAMDVIELFKALNGGCNRTTGEANAIAERFDALGTEVVEDFKEGEIGLRGKAVGAHTVLVLMAELLVELPGKEVEMLAGMLNYFSHITGIKPKYLDVKAN